MPMRYFEAPLPSMSNLLRAHPWSADTMSSKWWTFILTVMACTPLGMKTARTWPYMVFHIFSSGAAIGLVSLCRKRMWLRLVHFPGSHIVDVGDHMLEAVPYVLARFGVPLDAEVHFVEVLSEPGLVVLLASRVVSDPLSPDCHGMSRRRPAYAQP